MSRNPPAQPPTIQEVFPDRRLLWLVTAVTGAVASLGLVTFDYKRPPGTLWWVAYAVIVIQGAWLYIHVARAVGWRRAGRLFVGRQRGRLTMYFAPPQTAREQSVSGWAVWAAFCLSASVCTVVAVIFTIRILTLD